MTTKELTLLFFNWCELANISPTMFNVGFHEDCIEICTAPEHDEYYYHGNMGCEAYTESDITDFIRSVRNQNQYHKSKEEEC